MPYKSKGKKDCTQSDGSKGKYQTVKKNGTKRCYKSKKQYDAAMAWAHEADEAEYGEEINEDIMRILVKDFSVPVVESQSRIKAGAAGQKAVGDAFVMLDPAITYTSNSEGSTTTDVLLSVPGIQQPIKVEVKNSEKSARTCGGL